MAIGESRTLSDSDLALAVLVNVAVLYISSNDVLML